MELGVLWGISGDLINMRAHMRRVVVAVAAICIRCGHVVRDFESEAKTR